MVSGSETEDLDVGLLVAARSGEIDAIAAVCGHYRGRLMILARNAGAAEPDVVVQNALTETLLRIEPVESPSLADFERTLFDRVVVDSDPVPPRPGRSDHGESSARGSAEDPTEPVLPVHPGQATVGPLEDVAAIGGPVTADLWPDDEPSSRLFDGDPWIDERPLGAPVPGLVALTAPDANPMTGGGEPALFGPVPTAEIALVDPPQVETAQVEMAATGAGGALLSPHTGPVDWSASLAAQELPAEPVLVVPSKRLLAGAAAVVCGIGLLAAIALFFGDDSTDEPQLAALVPPNGDQPPASGGSTSGPASAPGGQSDQNRSSGAVTGSTDASGSSTTARQPSTTAAPSSTASTTVTTSPPSTAPSTTAEPTTTTEAPTTTRPETTTTSARRPGDFSGQSLDNRRFDNGDFRDHDFTNAQLNNVDFRGADLRGVSFAGAVLTNVQFNRVDLTGASFRGANMDNTSFNRRTNISGVDFRNSQLTNGRISSFFFDDNEPRSWPDGEFDFGDD